MSEDFRIDEPDNMQVTSERFVISNQTHLNNLNSW